MLACLFLEHTPGPRSHDSVWLETVFPLKSGHGAVGFRSVVAINGHAMARMMQGSLYLQDIRPYEGRALELELPDRPSGQRSAMESPVGHRSYDAIGWKPMDSLKRPNRRFGGAPIDAVDMNGDTLAA